LALDRMRRLRIELDHRVGALSGGQRAQVALALALAKRPELLVLDEPLASLDPLARREFLGSLMEAASEGDVTVLLSSHLVTDMERVCDYLIVLSASRIQVLGELEGLLAEHKVLTGPRTDSEEVAGVGLRPAHGPAIDAVRQDASTRPVSRVDGPRRLAGGPRACAPGA